MIASCEVWAMAYGQGGSVGALQARRALHLRVEVKPLRHTRHGRAGGVVSTCEQLNAVPCVSNIRQKHNTACLDTGNKSQVLRKRVCRGFLGKRVLIGFSVKLRVYTNPCLVMQPPDRPAVESYDGQCRWPSDDRERRYLCCRPVLLAPHGRRRGA
jgi:hypothetical protein